MTDIADRSAKLEDVKAVPVTAGRASLIVLTLAMGTFAIGTGEFAIMGLLPDIAMGLGTSVPGAGHLISAYALGVVLGAPLIALLAAKLSRRTLLLVLMLAFGAGNLASAVAPWPRSSPPRWRGRVSARSRSGECCSASRSPRWSGRRS